MSAASFFGQLMCEGKLQGELSFMKRLASLFPHSWQQELKRHYYRRQIRRQTFETAEPEFKLLSSIVSPGDWVIDVGANIGHYTKQFSELVGSEGRIFALEPVPDTFALLAANASLFKYRNVTLLNVAASESTTVVRMQVPRSQTGLLNYYQAAVTTGKSDLTALAIALDSIAFSHRISLIKIDAEGHDAAVLKGSQCLLTKDHPTLIVEAAPEPVVECLEQRGYSRERLPNSPNMLFRWRPENTIRRLESLS